MPTYQYVCTACDEPLEAVQSFSDASLTECPTCPGRLRKVYGAVGVVFKGSGFYKTDSRDAAKKKAEAPAAKSDGAATSTSTSSSSSDGGSSSSSTPAASTPSSTPAKTASTPASKSA